MGIYVQTNESAYESAVIDRMLRLLPDCAISKPLLASEVFACAHDARVLVSHLLILDSTAAAN